jgi:hypothetical protein
LVGAVFLRALFLSVSFVAVCEATATPLVLPALTTAHYTPKQVKTIAFSDMY